MSIQDEEFNMTLYINGQDQTGKKAEVLTKTGNYVVTIEDLGKSLRMDSSSDYGFTLPSVGATEDGSRITFNKSGSGRVTITAADSDLIADSAAGGTIYNASAETDANISLEYVHGIVTWIIRGAKGSWTTT